MKFDTEKKGIHCVLRDYEVLSLEAVWEKSTTGKEVSGVGSGFIHKYVNERLLEGRTISRASVIFGLKRLYNACLLGRYETTGKGGHYYEYTTHPKARNIEEVKKYLGEHLKTVLLAEGFLGDDK
ncbi:MAG: hypothetical protein ACTSWQ_11335 [Candidatus Thorarchaeota archaeon]